MSSAPPVSWYRLILHPVDPTTPAAAPGALIAALGGVGLIGEPFQFQGQEYFLPGERFLELVVFLGCSPVIELQRQDDRDGQPEMTRFCHVHVPAAWPTPRLHVGDSGAAPRCPHCRAPIVGWQQQLPDWMAQPLAAIWHCPACGEAASTAQIDWRRAAAVMGSSVELGGIHPYEGVPADELLATLARVTSRPWTHYYARPQLPLQC